MAVNNVLGVISKLMLENVANAVTNFHVGGDAVLDFIDTVAAQMVLGKPDENNVHPFTAEHVMIFNAGGTISQAQINVASREDIGTAGWISGIGGTNLGLGLEPTEAPQPTVKRAIIGLKETIGITTVNRDQILADDFGKVLAQFVTQLVTDVVKKLRNWRATSVYTDGTGWLSQVSDTSTQINSTADVEITLQNGSNRRFEIGERYDFCANTNWPVFNPSGVGDTSAALQNDEDVLCVGKSPKDLTKVKFRGKTGLTPFNATTGMHIVKKGTVTLGATHVSHMPSGFDNLINDTGTIHGLSRSSFEILQSQVEDTGSLTSLKTPRPEMITDLLDNIIDAGYEPPAFVVSSRNVRSKYAYNQGGQGSFILPNRIETADGGFRTVQTTYEDMVYNWMLSSFIEQHTMYGVEPRAFTKYAPGGDGVVQWWHRDGGLSGVDNIFAMVNSSNRSTKTFKADWSSHYELGIIQPFLNFVIRYIKGQRD
jgi:hypothetical protein